MLRIVAALLIALAPFGAAVAQERYPSRTVKLICWSSAGSPLDVMMRQVGRQLGDTFNQTFVVENRAGGEGAVAMAATLNSPADGYTILSTTSSMSFAMATRSGRYTPDDFIVLPALQSEPSSVAVRTDSPLKSMRDFVEAIRASPDRISVGGFSSAGFHQYVLYRLQELGRFKSVWVPFKGGQDATVALLGGHIQAGVMTPSSALSQIQNGDIRLIGISSAGRNEFLPNVPTFKEQGYDFTESIWRGVMVKAGTPGDIVATLVAALADMTKTREWREFSRINMQSAVDITLAGMHTQVRAEVAAYRKFLEAIGTAK